MPGNATRALHMQQNSATQADQGQASLRIRPGRVRAVQDEVCLRGCLDFFPVAVAQQIIAGLATPQVRLLSTGCEGYMTVEVEIDLRKLIELGRIGLWCVEKQWFLRTDGLLNCRGKASKC